MKYAIDNHSLSKILITVHKERYDNIRLHHNSTVEDSVETKSINDESKT
jgi:hypothetical protein